MADRALRGVGLGSKTFEDEQGVEFAERLEQQGPFLGRGGQLRRPVRHGVQPGPLDLQAPPVIDHQAMGDGGQVGAR